MSKKKFDPEKLKSLEATRDFIDSKKVEAEFDLILTTSLELYISLFDYCVTNFGLYQALKSVDKALRELENCGLMDLICLYSLQHPENKILQTYTESIQTFTDTFPVNRLQNFAIMEQKVLSEKNFVSPEHKYLKSIINVDWLKIIGSLEDDFLYRAIWISLNKSSPKWFTDLKEAIENTPNEIKNYFELTGKDLFNTNNLHSTTKSNSHIKLEKTNRLWDIIYRESIEPFEVAFQEARKTIFKDSMEQDDFNFLVSGCLNFYEEFKKLKFSTETPPSPNLLRYIYTVNDSKEPKYLLLHKIFLILYPNQFTSISDWEARNKASAITSKGSLVKEARETFTHEVKKFLSLY
jgi:hypothetical protein